MEYIDIYDIRLDTDRLPALLKEREVAFFGDPDEVKIDNPEKAAAVIEALWDASNLAQEKFWLLGMDKENNVKGAFTVTVGTLLSSLVHPREVLQRAMLIGADNIIVAHNHPSGQLRESESDKKVTTILDRAATKAGMRLIDHILVAGGDHISITPDHELGLTRQMSVAEESLVYRRSHDPLPETLKGTEIFQEYEALAAARELWGDKASDSDSLQVLALGGRREIKVAYTVPLPADAGTVGKVFAQAIMAGAASIIILGGDNDAYTNNILTADLNAYAEIYGIRIDDHIKTIDNHQHSNVAEPRPEYELGDIYLSPEYPGVYEAFIERVTATEDWEAKAAHHQSLRDTLSANKAIAEERNPTLTCRDTQISREDVR